MIKGSNKEKIVENIKKLHLGAYYDTEPVIAQTESPRISLARAEQLLDIWKEIQVRHEAQKLPDGRLINKFSDIEISKMKQKLFIDTGEDTIDTFQAFEHYKLFTEITERDRERFLFNQTL